MTPRARLLAAALFVLSLAPALALAHDEPPKTVAERQEQADRCALHAACRVQTQQLFVTRPGQDGDAEALFLTNTFDRAGHHLEQVVVDPAQAQRSVSRYDDSGNWLDEETWREGKLSERNTFAYDAQGCVTLITSEDLETGAREFLRYEPDHGGDAIRVTKTDSAGVTLYTIVYRYEPGSALGRLVAAEQREGVRTTQTWQDGRRHTKDVFGADGTLSWSFTYEYTAAGDLAQITRRDPAGAIVSRQVHAWRPDRLPDTG
ncbi:hypothetical protein FJ250_07700, partial [bacterium]|nr:hypothetical protein [bacterium]